MGYPRRRKKNKHGAKGVRIDGFYFHSIAESRRYTQLKKLVLAGIITDLELQPRFPFKKGGKVFLTYVSDFKYTERETGLVVIEEVKGYKTDTYKTKLRILKIFYPELFTEGSGIEFREIAAGKV